MQKKKTRVVKKKSIAKKTKPSSKKSGVTIKKITKKTRKISENKKEKKEKPVGRVTHYFGKIKVAVVRFHREIRVGKNVRYKGATTNFIDAITSMQRNHVAVKVAKKGILVGVKVKKKVRVGDVIYEIR